MAQPTLSPTEFASAVTAISSAFGDPTRRDIYLFVHEKPEGITASEAAEKFDVHPNVARHHLDKLAAGGHLEIAVGRLPGSPGAGRPSKRYRSRSGNVGLDLPVRHDDVLIALLGRALALLPADQAEAMAEDVGRQYGRTMAESIGSIGEVQRSFRTALHTVADALSAHGYAARTEEHADGELRIVSDHCPFGEAATQHPVLCAVDRGMVEGMLEALYGGTTARTEHSRAVGDPICVTSVTAWPD